MYNIKVIVHSRSSSNAGSRFTMFLHIINKIALRNSRIERIAISKEAGKWLFGGKSSFEVMKNGIDTIAFRFNAEMRKEVRKKFEITEQKFVVGISGHLSPVKNHDFLMYAFSMAAAKRYDLCLMVVGSGEKEGALKTLVEKLGIDKKVVFVGPQSNVAPFLCAMDIFAFPSLFEGFGRSLLEAQACGLPSMYSDRVPPDAAIQYNCVKLPLNYEIWAQHIVEGKKNPDHIREMAYIDIQRAGYDIRNGVMELEALYHVLFEKQNNVH